MKKLVLDDPDTKSADIVAGNVDALKALFPEAFEEGKIDFDVLRQLLGGAVDEKDEKYGLNWHGKRKARQIALTPSTGTLLPCPDESVDWDTTQNLMIEGDNLEVLKLLQKSYAGKVKLIYIDPPYNTGGDFIYPDNMSQPLDTYLSVTGQASGNGDKLVSNPESAGRFHSSWLSMMYSRLKVAKSLLAKDGVIFISLDDYEADNALKICDEVFGEENWLGTIPAIMNLKGNQDEYAFAGTHEYLLVYAKSKGDCRVFDWPLDEEEADDWLEDDRGPYKKGATLKRTGADAPRTERPNGWFPIFVRPDRTVYVTDDDKPEDKSHTTLWPISKGNEMSWRWSKAKVKQEFYDIIVVGDEDGPSLYKKQRPSISDLPSKKPKSVFYKPQYSSGNGTSEMEAIFGARVFNPPPKPLQFMKDIILIGAGDGGIVLDFFLGSGTTAHAVMEQNVLDGKDRRFVGIQLPHPIDETDTKNAAAIEFLTKNSKPALISELTKERLRRAGENLRKNFSTDTDCGFRAFKMASSNISAWNPDPADLDGTLLANAEHLVPGRTEQDVLYELLLKLGLDLCVPIEKKDIAGKAVHSVGGGALIVCLADGLTSDVVETVANGIVAWWKALAPAVDTRVVFKDSGFADDVTKANMAAILNQNGILDVRSL
ncbi:site-specific DNA-methyltransferase [Sphingopyxis terrae subsp. terrae]|nr:site-specific DNA-methyltransferase [Sphingopyxis terrae subsp. terrae]